LPERHGISSQRLERLHAGVRGYIDDGRHAGAISMILRDGAVVDFQTYGYRDIENKLPMEKDTICRVYSMTKVVTTVAVMVLYEEGRFKLDDPIGAYLPELAKMKVFKGGTAESPELIDAAGPITIKQLLTHTSGLGYDFGNSPIEQMYKNAKLWDAKSLPEFVSRVAKLPLNHQPGERWTYGINQDVLGALVEKLSGQKFEDFCEARIFKPLGMKDTGFSVPESRRGRIAKTYSPGPDGKLQEAPPIINVRPEGGAKLASGGGGLFSTIGDYARFAQMILNRGRLGDAQILGKKTVELMLANHMNHMTPPTIGGGADGFGFGGSVRTDLARGNTVGSVGQYGWSGAATTYFNIDPREQTVVLLFCQHFPYNQHDIFSRFSILFYQSIVE
jgi:CubicO group peptidase (beta-lactamase class C family)